MGGSSDLMHHGSSVPLQKFITFMDPIISSIWCRYFWSGRSGQETCDWRRIKKKSEPFKCLKVFCPGLLKTWKKTEGRSVQGSENGGFFEVLRNQIPKFGIFILCIFTLKIQIICEFEPSFQAQTCQIISSDVGSWLSLFSIKEGLQHTRRTMVVEQRCSQTLGQTAAKKHRKFVNVVLKQLLTMALAIIYIDKLTETSPIVQELRRKKTNMKRSLPHRQSRFSQLPSGQSLRRDPSVAVRSNAHALD